MDLRPGDPIAIVYSNGRRKYGWTFLGFLKAGGRTLVAYGKQNKRGRWFGMTTPDRIASVRKRGQAR